MFYGRVDRLAWDPHKFQWATTDKATQLMEFTSKMGRELLKKRHQVDNPITRKWGGVFPDNYRMQWKIVWLNERTRKEADLLWLI